MTTTKVLFALITSVLLLGVGIPNIYGQIIMDTTLTSTGMSVNIHRPIHIEYVTSSSELIGEQIDSIQIKLRKVGSPTGFADIGIIDQNKSVIKSFGKLDVSTLTTSYKDKTFTSSSYTIKAGDGIGIKYSSGNSSNLISIMRDISGSFDGTNTYHKYYTTYWINQPTKDLYMKLNKEISNNNDKVVFIQFDDGFKTQYTKALPIMEKYDIDSTIFIVCDYIGNSNRLSWNQVDDLDSKGHSIQNHGMSHAHLPTLSASQLDTNVKDCKNILSKHGSDGNAFAIPFNDGWNNKLVVETISKYHDFGKGRNSNLPQQLNCDGTCDIIVNGKFDGNNKITIQQWSHDAFMKKNSNEDIVFSKFKEIANQGTSNNIHVITYHRIDESGFTSPSLSLFEKEMKWLHDNGFKTLTFSDIEYDTVTNKFVIQ